MATNKKFVIDVLVTELTNLRIAFVNLMADTDSWCREQVRDQIAELQEKLDKVENWRDF